MQCRSRSMTAEVMELGMGQVWSMENDDQASRCRDGLLVRSRAALVQRYEAVLVHGKLAGYVLGVTWAMGHANSLQRRWPCS